jgi:hypothetical protein
MPALLNSRWILSVSCCLATSLWKRSTASLSETSTMWDVILSPCGRRSCRHSRSVSQSGRGDVAHRDAHTFGHELAHQLAAHARTAAGDDGDPACEVFHFIPFVRAT